MTIIPPLLPEPSAALSITSIRLLPSGSVPKRLASNFLRDVNKFFFLGLVGVGVGAGAGIGSS